MSHQIPETLKYTKDHEWTKIEGDVATIGITDFAQSALGDIVYVQLPEVGTSLEKEGAFGVVESIKSVSDLYSPLSGEVIEVNSDLEGAPEAINGGAYDAWIAKIKLSNLSEVESLMQPADYKNLCESEG